MGATTGITPVGDYSGATTGQDGLDILLALIPDPDTPPSQGGGAGIHGSHLDEMSPQAAAQLRVEIAALADVIGAFAAA